MNHALETNSRSRDIGIDIIKFFAVFLIINSHADICYAKYSMLATGGAIGDALFLFCSGYTLFWKNPVRFDNWYKRRICRIYPSVFAALIVSYVIGHIAINKMSLCDIFGGEFIVAIMIYYCLLYLIQKYFVDYLFKSIIFVLLVSLVAYYFFPYKQEVGERGIYGTITLFRWIPYFGIMLQGAWLGLNAKNKKIDLVFKYKELALLFIMVAIFYGIQIFSKMNLEYAPIQIITVPVLYLIVYYSWKCCYSSFIVKLYNSKIGNFLILFVGGLCLESYLIQCSIFTDKLNGIFPFNLPIIFLLIIVASFFVRCVARIFLQTFNKEDYDWKKVFALN